MLGIPVVSRSVIRVELNGPAEFLLRSLPVPIVVLDNQRQRGVGFRQVVINLKRADRRGAGFGHELALLKRARTQQGICIRKPGIGAGRVGILGDGLLIIVNGMLASVGWSLVPKILPLKVEIIGLVALERLRRG